MFCVALLRNEIIRGTSEFLLGFVWVRVCCPVLAPTGLLGQFFAVLIDGVTCVQLTFVVLFDHENLQIVIVYFT